MYHIVVNLSAAQNIPADIRFEEVELADPRRRGAARAAQPQQRQQGEQLKLPIKGASIMMYTQLADAEAEATKQASLAPTTQWAVLSFTKAFETTTPKVITKICNTDGELIPEPKEKATA